MPLSFVHRYHSIGARTSHAHMHACLIAAASLDELNAKRAAINTRDCDMCAREDDTEPSEGRIAAKQLVRDQA